MGSLTYDSVLKADFEDRLLSHLQIVIMAKLRRGESFMFSWKDDPSIGNGRTTIWIHPAVSLTFKFFGGRPPVVNRAWIDALMVTANGLTGLHITTEPTPEGPA